MNYSSLNYPNHYKFLKYASFKVRPILGEISYRKLEERIIDYNFIRVIENKASPVIFSFKDIPITNPIVATEVQGLRRIVEYSIGHAYRNYPVLFPDKPTFDQFLKSIVTNLYFEDANFYDSRAYTKFPSIGVYFNKSMRVKKKIWARKGIHIRLDGKNHNNAYSNQGYAHSRLDHSNHPCHTLVHEIGHGLHDFLSLNGLIEHGYHDYDDKMKEVLAIVSDRTVGKRTYHRNPHKTALKLVLKLERFSFFKEKSLAQRLEYLFNFIDHKHLAEAIKFNEGHYKN